MLRRLIPETREDDQDSTLKIYKKISMTLSLSTSIRAHYPFSPYWKRRPPLTQSYTTSTSQKFLSCSTWRSTSTAFAYFSTDEDGQGPIERIFIAQYSPSSSSISRIIFRLEYLLTLVMNPGTTYIFQNPATTSENLNRIMPISVATSPPAFQDHY